MAEAIVEIPAGPLVGNGTARMPVPAAFCWTKYGSEAGETIDAIFARKEQERVGNGGIFLWGIGNGLGPSLRQLVLSEANPRVLFSPMKSAPAAQDVKPRSVSLWDSGIGFGGEPFELPLHSVVTSRTNGRGFHWALVCRRETPLVDARDTFEDLAINHLRNLGTGAIVGSSQVTSVVRHKQDGADRGRSYPVTVAADLVPPYLVRLTHGVVVPEGSASPPTVSELLELRRKARRVEVIPQRPSPLF